MRFSHFPHLCLSTPPLREGAGGVDVTRGLIVLLCPDGHLKELIMLSWHHSRPQYKKSRDAKSCVSRSVAPRVNSLSSVTRRKILRLPGCRVACQFIIIGNETQNFASLQGCRAACQFIVSSSETQDFASLHNQARVRYCDGVRPRTRLKVRVKLPGSVKPHCIATSAICRPLSSRLQARCICMAWM